MPCLFERGGGAWKPRNRNRRSIFGRVAGAYVQGFGPKASAPVGFLQVSNIRLPAGSLRSVLEARVSSDSNKRVPPPDRAKLAELDKLLDRPAWWQTWSGRSAALFWLAFAAGILWERVTWTEGRPNWVTLAVWLWPIPPAALLGYWFRGPKTWQDRAADRDAALADEQWRRTPARTRLKYLLWLCGALAYVVALALLLGWFVQLRAWNDAVHILAYLVAVVLLSAPFLALRYHSTRGPEDPG